MGFKDHKVKSEYRSLIDNVVQDFYIPLLKDAVSYKRAVGFFSSSSLVEISKGIAGMAAEGGKIQIVASPYLSDEDIDAIRHGYEDRNKIIERALLTQISEKPADYYSMERLNLLAALIADGVMDIQIAYTEDKNGNRKEYTGDDSWELEIPMAVLVNEYSASASEILAGAIQDYNKGTLIGTTTYGKGIVQQIHRLDDGTAIKLTISAYFTPSGRNIHGVGIEPDIELEYDYERSETDGIDNQVEKAVEVLKGKIE